MDELSHATAFLASSVVGIVLVLAGFSKARNLDEFTRSLGGYAFLPRRAVPLFIVTLPVCEIALGLALLLGVAPLFTSPVAVAMFATFTAATILAFGWQSRHECRCFGHLTSTTVRALAVRNAALSTLAIASATSSLALAPAAIVALSALSIASLLALIASTTAGRSQTQDLSDGQAEDPARRRFLRFAASIAGAGTLLALTKGVDVAEAGCSPCGSCASQYIFIGCSGGGCAMYWVRKRTFCETGCSTCGAWQIQEFCGIPGC